MGVFECVLQMCMIQRVWAKFPAEKRVGGKKGERARAIATDRQPVPGSPFYSQMTYLDSFMFAWRRIKKALHFPFYRLGTHVSAALLKAL